MSVKIKNVRSIKIAVGTVLIFLAVISVLIYWFFGIKYVFELQNILSNHSEAEKMKVREMLTVNPNANNIFRGILLRVIGNNESLKGIFVWNYSGLKYFKTSSEITYNTFSICEGRKWESTSGTIHKSDNMNYPEWYKEVRQGDYLEVSLNEAGLLQNVNGYDWWAFASPVPFSYLEFTCQNR